MATVVVLIDKIIGDVTEINGQLYFSRTVSQILDAHSQVHDY